MVSAPSNKIEMAHQIYRDGKYEAALGFYTEALSMAKTKAQTIALHSNRAACYLKLHDFKKAAEECTSVLELDHNHAGALMLRAQTLVTLKDYHSALFDVNRLMGLNPSSEVYRNLETRLRTQLALAPIPESEAELEEEEEKDEIEPCGLEEEHGDGKADAPMIGTDKKTEPSRTTDAEVIVPKISNVSREHRFETRKTIAAEAIAQAQRKVEPRKTLAAEVIAQAQRKKESSDQHSKGWQSIPKPKGHSALDYARWDRVEDDSSEDDDDDDDEEQSQPQYRFRVRTVGVRPVK
ncbi:FK506-binding protein 59 [Ricinus communis]|uniref:Heat shock protein 70 (HSP70)-interacting protein, putative n=1 Tax=Ricinus communis TaxID=3988 RepID=B9RI19_RICCO|nr:FK506-binding protein 59 [Ricinus communis]EEF48791.1 heat shock protein 70 (HSP70)-interacting protein, putative [Ricinus communis]|eukprot:XP_002513388.1 FK506-binding protein 59 [Ricinus communis]